ncbi:YheC/YheD family protein [Paenibacillus alkalitolerans]|uniref:YheC/YheD family protein n=1 Tax=Paenibacillus alkalitolerans TaxID=2799335 RepID=UPI001F1A9264|nr:YheC/YheD family protein [Paenibacillus alkalitolerans]
MRRVASKWAKFQVLRRHSGAAKHVPYMQLFSSSALRGMLSRFSFVVAKPVVGSGGYGVIKIERVGESGYRYHYKSRTKVHQSWNGLISDINRIRGSRKYMLQQGIDLATIHGRRVDYRVKLVKRGSGWKITAVVGRLARPGLFVTNLSRGGTLMKGREALRRTFPRLVKSKKDTMTGVARTCTFLLESRYPGIGELGYDFGIDKRGTVWIFEVNTRPQ